MSRATPRIAEGVKLRLRVKTTIQTLTVAAAAEGAAEEVLGSGTRFTVSLRKPLGIVLEQDAASGNIVVTSVVEDSAASKVRGPPRGMSPAVWQDFVMNPTRARTMTLRTGSNPDARLIS